MGFISISFQGPSLKKAFSELCLCLSLGLSCLHKHLHQFCEKVLGGSKNKRLNRILRRGKSFVAANIGSPDWALGAGKLILLYEIDRRINARALSVGARLWSHCNRKSKHDSSKRANLPVGYRTFKIVN